MTDQNAPTVVLVSLKLYLSSSETVVCTNGFRSSTFLVFAVPNEDLRVSRLDILEGLVIKLSEG